MHGSGLAARTRAELEAIMPLVSALTGLPTRWSGMVELVDTTEFRGKKRFTCDIQIAASVAEEEGRWATLIHETLHCHSAGYSGNDYRDHRGWEEGVVEQLQRLLRPQILAQLGVTVEPAVFRRSADFHRYNRYLRAWKICALPCRSSPTRRRHSTKPCWRRQSAAEPRWRWDGARRFRLLTAWNLSPTSRRPTTN